jgi:DNA modification methylase
MSALVINGDARRLPLADGVAQCCVTSPPYYGLRDYGADGQIGLEQTPADYVAAMVAVFRDVRRVLADDGVCWLNLGDSYATGGGSVGRAPGGGDQGERFIRAGMIGTQPNRMPLPGLKPKDLIGIPWLVAFALQSDGWYLRSDVIWAKPNPMPESVRDRPTKAHEYVFLLSKRAAYYYDADAVRDECTGSGGAAFGKVRMADESAGAMAQARRNSMADRQRYIETGKNARTVWTINPRPFSGAHFATMPPELAERCIKAGSRPGDLVIDPFTGAGTTGAVAVGLGRRFAGTELNPTYAAMARRRIERPHAPVERPAREVAMPLFSDA